MWIFFRISNLFICPIHECHTEELQTEQTLLHKQTRNEYENYGQNVALLGLMHVVHCIAEVCYPW